MMPAIHTRVRLVNGMRDLAILYQMSRTLTPSYYRPGSMVIPVTRESTAAEIDLCVNAVLQEFRTICDRDRMYLWYYNIETIDNSESIACTAFFVYRHVAVPLVT